MSKLKSTISATLIVDDNGADREWSRVVLGQTKRFKNILEATTGSEALDLFLNYEASRARHPDAFPPLLIVLDINMPAMDGFEFLERFASQREELRRRGAEPCVIMMISSSNDPRDRKRAKDLVEDFITKPLTQEQAHRIADMFGTS